MIRANIRGIDACVFDAYGTLFDFNAATERCRAELGDKTEALSSLWRRKQLEYTWLRSLMGRYASFWQVTGEALDSAMKSLALNDAVLRARLLELYLTLDAYPDVAEVLEELQAAEHKTAILSNGSPEMLTAAVSSAGIGGLLDAVLSAEEVGIFKPHPAVYQLAVNRLGIEASRIVFLSANDWDAAGAAAFGFRAVWINRSGQGREPLPAQPETEITSLAELPALLVC